MTHALSLVQTFLNKEWDGSSPLLLALSGGRDSLALLHVLASLKLPLHVVHVDHGWREESAQEAKVVEQFAHQYGAHFHTTRLDPSGYKGNWEASARAERYRFFKEVAQKIGAQAVITAHHQRDQAETVLKMVLQGNPLPHIGGMEPVSQQGSLTLWRPWLELSHEAICSYAEQHKLPFLNDSTNDDPYFLRTRMRQELFPRLETFFHKKIESPLARLGQEAQEWEAYLERRVAPLWDKIIIRPYRAYLAIPQGVERVELKYLLQKLVAEFGCPLPLPIIEQMVDLLLSGESNKSLKAGGLHLEIDRGRLFLWKGELGPWEVTIQKGKPQEQKSALESIWAGERQIGLPEEPDTIAVAEPHARDTRGKLLKSLWSDAKVPAFLRTQIPVLTRNGRVIGEFLTDNSCTNKTLCVAILKELGASDT